jgi:diguanylate cyclase (GGDEF)-like protein
MRPIMTAEPSAPAAPVAPAPRERLPAPSARFRRLARARTLDELCQGLADDLLELGFELPSIYLLTGRRLRCHAARGYFQVVDGFRPGSGVIGGVVAAGEPVFVPDVSAREDFIAAIPGLVAEACAPVRLRGEVVGAVSVESCTALPADTPAVLDAAALLLGRRLEQLGGLSQPSPPQRLAQISVELTAASSFGALAERAARAAVEVSGMSSAAVVQLDPPGRNAVRRATGPLAARLRTLTSDDLDVMASWVGYGTSSHFPGGEEVPPGYRFLSSAGVRAMSVHPLAVGGQVRGLLVVADEKPVAHAPSVVDLLELLAAQTAASLAMAALLRDVQLRAERDELTGLHNRHGFSAVLTSMLDQSRGQRPLSVLLLDLDDFKHVNDSLGHEAGDRMLVDVAERLRAVLRPADAACRLGGDEFVVLLADADESGALAVAERLLDALAAVSVGDVEVGATASVGIAVLGGTTDSAETLLRAADLAMYAAKRRGKGRCVVFEPHMQANAVRRMAMVRDLRRALRDDALTLAYQPVVELATGRVTAVEALARWNDPVRGPVPPGEFVRLAEETGDIADLGAWVLRTACRQLLAWQDAGVDDVTVCVNVSTRQLERRALLPALDACLDTGVDPRRLLLEITETALAQDSTQAEHTLREVRARGIALAVDDFGTGYSSLGRLRSSPVSGLKIDRSFVSEIGDRAGSAPIVDATLAMAAGLGLEVVAEGVETRGQLAYLRDRGCPLAQGFLLARPLPPDEVLPLLLGERPWAALFS